MIDILEAIFLGVVQGIVDPMPVSSSGHLVLVQHFLGIEQRLTLSVFLHFGNLMAIILVFRHDIREIFSLKPGYPRLLKYIILGIIPVGFFGFFFRSFFDTVFGTTVIVGFMLLITGIVLYASRMADRHGRPLKKMKLKDAAFVGFAQAAALFPGLSRSGMTIVSGLFSGLDRQLAVKYSFLMSIPVVFAASMLEAFTIYQEGFGDVTAGMIIAGTLSAVISGFAAIKLLQEIVDRRRLYAFAYYCWMLGILLLIIFL